MLPVELCRRIQILRGKVSRECNWQPQHPGQLRTEAARSQQGDRYIAALPRNRFHCLPGFFGPEVCTEFLQQSWKILSVLPQIATQRPHRLKAAAGSTSQPQID